MTLCFHLHSLQLTAHHLQRSRWRRTKLVVVGVLMETLTKVWLPWREFPWCRKPRLCWLESGGISCPAVVIGTAGWVSWLTSGYTARKNLQTLNTYRETSLVSEVQGWLSSLFGQRCSTLFAIILPKNLFLFCLNVHLLKHSLRAATSIHWNTNSMFWRSSSSTVRAGMPMSSKHWSHLPAFSIGSWHFRTKLLNAESDLLKPWARGWYAKTRSLKLNGKSWIDCLSAICRHG